MRRQGSGASAARLHLQRLAVGQQTGYTNGMWSRLARACLGAVLAAVVAGAGCGAGEGAQPRPLLSKTLPPQLAMQSITQRFSRAATPEERAALEPDLRALVRDHGDDDAVYMAGALLAWIALERGELDEAERVARSVADRPPAAAGVDRDVARALLGAVLRRRGKSLEALELLGPLFGKLLDGYARAFLNEEVVRAAFDAGRHDVALSLLAAWLRSPEGPRDRLSARAAEWLVAVESAQLEAWLVAALGQPEDARSPDMLRLATSRLADVALALSDASLARRLLDRASELLGDPSGKDARALERAERLAKLALGASAPRLEARTLGLLLSATDAGAIERSVELSAGASAALGLPGGEARITTATDGGKESQAREACAALVRDGAVVILAGTSAAQAKQAAEFARDEAVPVLLLRPVDASVASAWAFVVGESPTASAKTLVAALTGRGAKRVGAVMEDGAAPPEGVAKSAECNDAWDAAAWKREGLDAVALTGTGRCVRAAAARATAAGLRVGASPDGAAATGLSALAGGGFLPLSTHQAVNRAARPPELLAFWRTHRDVTWWHGLGHDAALLAWDAVRGAALESTEEAAKIAAARAKVRLALEQSNAQGLWTSASGTFGGARSLARTLDALRPEAVGPPPPAPARR